MFAHRLMGCAQQGFSVSAKYGHSSVIRKLSQKQTVKASAYKIPPLPKIMLVSDKDLMDFHASFPEIVHQLTNLPELKPLTETNERIASLLEYNVPHGKLIRAQMALAANNILPKEQQRSNQMMHTLAWAIEMLQGSACIADDLVDRSLTRRNRPCWHIKGDLGIAAVNDGFLLENLAYRLLELHFKNEPFYADIVSLLHGIAVRALCGQSYDVTNCGRGFYDKLTMETYSNMMKFKNGFYTFYGPIALIQVLEGVKNQKIYKQLEQVSLDIGLLYSIQDDFMDCFVDESLTGKLGTDIADGKYSWPLVVALERANESQRKMLVENYGQGLDAPEKIERVKEIYLDLGVPEIFKHLEEKSREAINKGISNLPPSLPRPVIQNVAEALIPVQKTVSRVLLGKSIMIQQSSSAEISDIFCRKPRQNFSAENLL